MCITSRQATTSLSALQGQILQPVRADKLVFGVEMVKPVPSSMRSMAELCFSIITRRVLVAEKGPPLATCLACAHRREHALSRGVVQAAAAATD